MSALGVLAAKSAHGVTGVATFILLADIGNQRLRALHFDFEGGQHCQAAGVAEAAAGVSCFIQI